MKLRNILNFCYHQYYTFVPLKRVIMWEIVVDKVHISIDVEPRPKKNQSVKSVNLLYFQY